MSLRCVVVEDQVMFRQLLVAMLRTQPQLAVVATAGAAAEGIAACREHQPDLVILDLELPDAEGLSVARALRREHPRGRVIILSSHASSFQRPTDLRDTIHAVVDKTRAYEDLLLEVAALGGNDHHAGSAETLSPELLESLTPREGEILALIGQGRSSQQIADSLAVSVHTVTTHRRRISDKLGISGSALVHHATLWVQRRLGP